MNPNILADNLKKLRTEKNYTQEQVAEILGVSPQAVSRWECRNTLPDALLLPEIAKLYGVTIDDLFRENITAYQNYAVRLLAVFELTGKTEDFVLAEAEFEKLFKSDCCSVNDLRSFGVLYHYMAKICNEKAEKFLDMSAEISKNIDSENYYKARSQKIALLSEFGKSEQNITEYTEAVEKNPDDQMLYSLLVASYYFAKRYDEAYDVCMKGIEKFEDNSHLHVYAGDICRELKKYDEAYSHWNKAFEADCRFLDAKYSVAFCYEETGEYKKAYHAWNEISAELEKRGLSVEKEFSDGRAK
ncbi:MAG: helix-turn-helix domain-containing protein, partial [Oscillospiraceae bacterium]|nr:helix-turn-helix domain-containing protein [Oscillospiraceae bacterium]